MKIVCVSNGPLPYHTPILNELAKLADLHVIYMSSGHPMGSFQDVWGVEPEFSHSTYWSLSLGSHASDFRAQLSLGVSLRLRKLNPDVIFFSSWGPLVLEPLLWKCLAQRKAVMWAESTSFSGLFRSRVANLIRRRILSHADAFVTNGTQATAYLKTLGVGDERIVSSCLPSRGSTGLAERPEPRVRTQAASDAPRYLFVGRLIRRKRPLELLTSFASVIEQRPSARLTIVGDGPLRPEVARAAEPFGTSVSLPGRVEGEALHEAYAAADVLVLPAVREVWGLVVNEALAHGLYVVATDQVGSAYDLLDETSGVIVPADDQPTLTDAMLAAGRNGVRDPAARDARIRRMAGRTPAAFARDIHRAANLALGAADER